MNILVLSGVFPPEPVTSALLNFDLALALSKEHNVTVLRQKPTRPMGKDYSGYIDVFPFQCITLDSYTCPESKLICRFRESYSYGKHCAEYIRRHCKEFDVVYNDSWALFGYYLSAKACHDCNLPYVTPIQDIYPECLFTGKSYPAIVSKFATWILKPLDDYNQNHAYKVRTISDEMADYLSKTRKVPRENYLVLDNWQNDEDFTYKPLTQEKIIFGYVGSVNSHSNTELIIKAFAKASIPGAELRIYGGGNHKDACVQLVKELGVENVKFDVVDKKQVPEVQSNCSVLVLALPKGNGGLCLPSKMTSYLLSGRAVLASVEKSATTRYIKEADCGITVEPDNIDALAEGFTRFAGMSLDELNRLGKNSREFAEKKLTRASNLPKVMEALINAKK